jgi:methionine salvage enolase-phosphatase E1
LLILKFRLYFAPKNGGQNIRNETLFSLCANALKDYVEKETNLSQIKREQLSIAQSPREQNISRRQSANSAAQKHDDDTQIENLEEALKGSSDADL